MARFEANDLQKALFIEVMSSSLAGSGNDLVHRSQAVHAWLVQMKPTLAALANLGRAVVRNGRSDNNTMRLDFMRAMDPLPHEVLRWLDNWKCLRDLVSPNALAGLSKEDCRTNFQTLATLDAGL